MTFEEMEEYGLDKIREEILDSFIQEIDPEEAVMVLYYRTPDTAVADPYLALINMVNRDPESTCEAQNGTPTIICYCGHIEDHIDTEGMKEEEKQQFFDSLKKKYIRKMLEEEPLEEIYRVKDFNSLAFARLPWFFAIEEEMKDRARIRDLYYLYKKKYLEENYGLDEDAVAKIIELGMV